MALGPVDNPRAILREIYVRGPTSRSDLAHATGLTGAAVSRITRTLLDDNILVEGEKLDVSGKLGRKFVALNFSNARYVVGIGIQAVSQWIEIADLQGQVIGRRIMAMPKISDPHAVLDHCAKELGELFKQHKISRRSVCGIGLSIAGVIDTRIGNVVRAQNLGWTNVPAARIMHRATGLPVYAETLLNSIILAHNGFGLVDSQRNCVLVAVSLGIGASILVNGALVSGVGLAAGQIGHVQVPGGSKLCVCGRKGCLDTEASGRAILAHFGVLDPKEVIDSVRHKSALELFGELSRRATVEPRVAKVLFNAGQSLGHILGVATSLLDPGSFILTGMVSEDDNYMAGVQHSLAWYLDGTSRQAPQVHRLNSTNTPAPTKLAFARFVLSNSEMAYSQDD